MRANRLRTAREMAGLTQEDLAKRTQLGQKQIWRYENGENDPSGNIIAALAKELNVSADYLLGLTDDPSGHLTLDLLSPVEQQLIMAQRRGDLKELLRLLAQTGEGPG